MLKARESSRGGEGIFKHFVIHNYRIIDLR